MQKGKPLMEAVIESAVVRLRSIITTALMTGLALLPTLFPLFVKGKSVE